MKKLLLTFALLAAGVGAQAFAAGSCEPEQLASTGNGGGLYWSNVTRSCSVDICLPSPYNSCVPVTCTDSWTEVYTPQGQWLYNTNIVDNCSKYGF